MNLNNVIIVISLRKDEGMKMNIAIIDDLQEEIDKLKEILIKYSSENNIKFNMDFFLSAEDFFKNYHPCKYSVIFMDIYMDNMTGMEAAEKIYSDNVETKIIFLTTSTDHMPDAFRCHAYDYVLKPATRERIFKIFDDIITTNAGSDKILTLVSDRENITLPYSDIVSIKSSNHNIEVTTNSGKVYITRQTFSSIEKKLIHDSRFLLIIRGVIVNMDYIIRFSNHSCSLKDGSTLPVNSRKFKSLEKIWANYMFSRIRSE